MKDGFTPKQGDRSKLSSNELHVLDLQVLPTARQWVENYPVGSSLHGHGMTTLAYWGEMT